MTPADFHPLAGVRGSIEIAADGSRKLSLQVAASPGAAFKNCLGDSVFGSAGIRYRRLDVDRQLGRFPCPVFVELLSNGQLAGAYLFSIQPLVVNGQPALGVYRGMLTVKEEYKGRGLGRWMVEHSIDWIERATADAGVPVLSWGCIDASNERSLRLLQSLGARRLGSLVSMLVYRQWPAERIAIEEAEQGSLEDDMRQSLSDCVVTKRGCTPGAHYRVSGDEALPSAATVNEVRLEMQAMGSHWDAMYRLLLKHAAPARRRFDPDNFRYLRLADLVVDRANVRCWPAFVSTLLARHDLHMAMFVLDPASSQFRLLDEAGVFGRFGRATQQQIEVLGQAWHCDADFLPAVAAAPLGIGPLGT